MSHIEHARIGRHSAAVDLQVVAAQGVALRVRRVGDPGREPVVMLHGLMGHCREWDTVVDRLAEDRCVFAVDQRGHGRSDRATDYGPEAFAADLIAVLEQLVAGSATVIGHSMGGIATVLAAAQRPDLVRRLVVIDIGPDSVTPEASAAIDDFLRHLAESRYCDVEDALMDWAGNPLAEPAHLRHYVEHCLVEHDGRLTWRFDGHGLTGFGRRVDAAALWRAIDAITAPTLVVRGEHSEMLTPGTATEMVRRLGSAKLVTVAGGGHDLGVEQPVAVGEAIIRFLAEVDSAVTR